MKMEIILWLLGVLFAFLCLRFMVREYAKFCRQYAEEALKQEEEEKKELLQEIEKLLQSKR